MTDTIKVRKWCYECNVHWAAIVICIAGKRFPLCDLCAEKLVYQILEQFDIRDKCRLEIEE